MGHANKAASRYRDSSQHQNIALNISNMLNRRQNDVGHFEFIQPNRARHSFLGGDTNFHISPFQQRVLHHNHPTLGMGTMKHMTHKLRLHRENLNIIQQEGKSVTQTLDAYVKQGKDVEASLQQDSSALEKGSGDIERGKADYERELNKYNEGVSALQSSNSELTKLTNLFQEEAPALAKSIKQYQDMPTKYLQNVDKAKQSKANLSGYNEYEKGSEFKEHGKNVDELKVSKGKLEESIKSQFSNLEGKTSAYNKKRDNLMNLWNQHKFKQDQLMNKNQELEQKRASFESRISHYNNLQKSQSNKADQLTSISQNIQSTYSKVKNLESRHAENERQKDVASHWLQNKLNWHNSEGRRLNADAQMHAGKAKRNHQMWNNPLVKIGVGILTGGFGLVAHKAISDAKGWSEKGGNYGHTSYQAHGSGSAASASSISALKNYSKVAPISSGILGNKPKTLIPELGGLNSIKHFGMPQMPKAHELPSLSESLGKIKDVGDLSKLTLGLPMTSGHKGTGFNKKIMYSEDYLGSTDKYKKNKRGKGNRYRYFGKIGLKDKQPLGIAGY